MKLYDSVGPDPRIVLMFMAEKGIEIPKQAVDLRKGENREAEHLKRNPHGQMPALELDNGHYLSEITAICEYLEDKHPNPPLIGATPEERAECRMDRPSSSSSPSRAGRPRGGPSGPRPSGSAEAARTSGDSVRRCPRGSRSSARPPASTLAS